MTLKTFLLPGEFCTNCEAVGHRGRVAFWRCRGHDEAAERPERPAKSSAEHCRSGEVGTAGPSGPASSSGEGLSGPSLGGRLPGRPVGARGSTDPPRPAAPKEADRHDGVATVEETEEILRRLQAEERGSSTYGRPRPRSSTAVRPIPRVDLHGARSPMKFVGDLRVARRTFVDSATLRGTWPGGPAVQDIKKACGAG